MSPRYYIKCIDCGRGERSKNYASLESGAPPSRVRNLRIRFEIRNDSIALPVKKGGIYDITKTKHKIKAWIQLFGIFCFKFYSTFMGGKIQYSIIDINVKFRFLSNDQRRWLRYFGSTSYWEYSEIFRNRRISRYLSYSRMSIKRFRTYMFLTKKSWGCIATIVVV